MTSMSGIHQTDTCDADDGKPCAQCQWADKQERERCEHGAIGYCFPCVRKRHNQEMLDGKYDSVNVDEAAAFIHQHDSPASRRTRSIVHHWEMVEDQMRVEHDFESEWSTAASPLTRYVEREIAEAWWLLGRKAGIAEAISDQNEDYREILRVARERLK